MAVSSQAGVFGFGGQTGKGSVATTWYRHRGADIDLATLDDTRLGPPEVGGQPFPTLPYKAGVLASGGALLQPRLEDTFGWLMYGALGAVATTGPTGVALYTHVFKPATAAEVIPWMSFRKHIPGAEGSIANDLGEVFQDCKIVNLTFNLPNDGLITSRIDALGRIPSWDVAPSAWTWANSFEDYQSIPIGVVTSGFFKIPSFSATELPITSATVGIQNVPLDLRSERVYGSPYIEDVTIVGRAVTVDFMLKWNDPTLYQSVLTGSSGGTTWSPDPFVSDLQILAASPNNITGESVPYSLQVDVQQMMFQVVGGIRLAGNSAVMLRVTGTGLVPNSGDYATFTVKNLATGYTWPS